VSTFEITLDPTTQNHVQLVSMLLPSNDTFFGNDDPLQILDADGNFIGPSSITFGAGQLYDAGTEVNDFTNGIAFVQGVDITDGALELDENGNPQVIRGGVTFESLGLGPEDLSLVPNDEVLSLMVAQDFFNKFNGNGKLASVSFEVVDSEVPVPAAALLFAPVVAGFALRRRQRQRGNA